MSAVYLRRKARAALQGAFEQAGIPMDYIVYPHQDDTERLLVVSDFEVRWIDDYETYRRAEIHFVGDLVGVVAGQDMWRISQADGFDPEDYGIYRPYRFEFPFDLTDMEASMRRGWEELPLANIRKLPKPIASRKYKRVYQR